MPRRSSSRGDKRAVLEQTRDERSTYECFRSRAVVDGHDLSSSFTSLSLSSDGYNPLASTSTIQTDRVDSSASNNITDENNVQNDDEVYEMPENMTQSLKASLLPSRGNNNLTAMKRLQTAATTAAVTNELLRLLTDDGDETEEVNLESDIINEENGATCPKRVSLMAAVHLITAIKRSSKTTLQTTHPRNAGQYTIIAFVNSASGGGKGVKLYKTLQGRLGEEYVFDLKSCRPGNMPEDTLIRYAADPFVRVLACGGDGTCGWIFSSLDKVWLRILGERSPTSRIHLSKYKDHLPLAIMPLGTGNDLSRQFHWGKKFNHSMTKKSMIESVQSGRITKLDRWRCIIMPFSELGEEEKECIPSILSGSNAATKEKFIDEFLATSKEKTVGPRKSRPHSNSYTIPGPTQIASTQFFDGVFCNYLSFGFDATVAYLFHHERENHPERFTSPTKNKLIYVQKSPSAMRAPKLKGRMKIMVAGEDGELVNLPIPKSCRAVVLMNIQSYGGGNHLANEGSPTDGLIEVIFVSNLIRTATSIAVGKVLPFMLFNVAAKTNRIVFRTMCPLHCQVDGEPWLQSEGIVQVKFHARNAILEKVTNSGKCDCMGEAEGDVLSAQQSS